MRPLTAITVALASACSSGSGETRAKADTSAAPRTEQDLATPADWVLLSATADPFGDHRPTEGLCADQDVVEEDGTLELSTARCDYATLQAPARAPVIEGDTVEMLLLHTALVSAEPAEAHVAVMLGGTLFWEVQIPIPSGSGVYPYAAPLDRPMEAGEDLILHIHNHGANSWTLGHLRVVPPGQ